MRLSGSLQAAIIALAAGFALRNVPATATAAWWPNLLFGYAFVAALLPWLLGGYFEVEFRPVFSLILGVFVALPFWVAARWLADSPYHLITTGCRIMVGLWSLHLLISLGAWVHTHRKPAPP